nr:MAG TPA_asm: YadA-like protein [Caudoviricetes sp.]
MKKTLIALCVTFVASSQLTMAEVVRSAVAIGNYVTAEGAGSTAVGMHSHAYGNLSSAYGAHAVATGVTSQAFGSEAWAKGYSTTALGKGTLAEGSASTAVGAHATAKGNSSVALALHANAIGGQSVALGQASVARGDQSTAVGSGATTEARFSTAVGTNAKANHYSSVAVGFNSTTSDYKGVVNATIDGVTYGNYAGHRPTSVVSFGSEGFERQLQNVAAGNVTKTSTDAVNGSQLYAVASQVSTNVKVNNEQDIRIAANSERITNVYNTVQSYSSWMETQESQIYDLKLRDRDLREKITELNKLIDGNFDAIRNDINKNRRDSNAGIAGAIAIGTMMQPYEAGQSAITVGAGSFKNEAAIAIGASHITENGKWGFKGGVSADTRKNIGVGLSAAYFFGAKPKPVAAPQQVIVKETVVVREPVAATEKKIRQ